MERSLKIFLACAFGGLIGTAVAIQLNSYLWWLGVIAGGMVGYISYEFSTVVLTIRQVWKKVAESDLLDKADVKNILNICALIWCVTSIIFFSKLLDRVLFPYGPAATLKDFFVLNSFKQLAVFGGYIVCVLTAVHVGLVELTIIHTGPYANQSNLKGAVLFVLIVNPISLFVFVSIRIVIRTFKLLVRMIKKFAHLVPKIILVIKKVFITIHSELRLLCMTDASLGCIIGYFVGNVLVGALAGGLLGVLNYEVVSKRILKLVPAAK